MFDAILHPKKNKDRIFIINEMDAPLVFVDNVAETGHKVPVISPSISETIPLLGIKRLVVIVPNQDLDDVTLSREIWSLAAYSAHNILYMSVIENDAQTAGARRRLVTLAAITRDAQTQVEIQVLIAPTWINGVKDIWNEGDMLVCLAGQTISQGLRKRIPLENALVSALKVEVVLLKGIYQETAIPNERRVHPALYWVGILAIIGLFTRFEMAITQEANNWVGQLLFIFIILIEIIAVTAWTAAAG